MKYEVVRGPRQMWDVVTSENEKTIIYCSRCFREEADRIAALLNKSDGMTTEAIEDAIPDGGLARMVRERERLRAASREALNYVYRNGDQGGPLDDLLIAALADDD